MIPRPGRFMNPTSTAHIAQRDKRQIVFSSNNYISMLLCLVKGPDGVFLISVVAEEFGVHRRKALRVVVEIERATFLIRVEDCRAEHLRLLDEIVRG